MLMIPFQLTLHPASLAFLEQSSLYSPIKRLLMFLPPLFMEYPNSTQNWHLRLSTMELQPHILHQILILARSEPPSPPCSFQPAAFAHSGLPAKDLPPPANPKSRRTPNFRVTDSFHVAPLQSSHCVTNFYSRFCMLLWALCLLLTSVAI